MEAVVCTRPKYRWPLLFCSGSSFRSRLSLGGGTGNGPMISLRPSLITEHHSVSSLNDLAREASPCSRYLRPARDVDTTYTVGRNVHESMVTNVRAHRAANLLPGCVGRSDRKRNAAVCSCPAVYRGVRSGSRPSGRSDLSADTWTEAFGPSPIRVEETRARSPTVRPRPIWEIRANSMVPSREGELWWRPSVKPDGRISPVVRTGR